MQFTDVDNDLSWHKACKLVVRGGRREVALSIPKNLLEIVFVSRERRRIGRISFHWETGLAETKEKWNEIEIGGGGGGSTDRKRESERERVELGKIRKSVERKKKEEKKRKEKGKKKVKRVFSNRRFCFLKSLPGREISGRQTTKGSTTSSIRAQQGN